MQRCYGPRTADVILCSSLCSSEQIHRSQPASTDTAPLEMKVGLLLGPRCPKSSKPGDAQFVTGMTCRVSVYRKPTRRVLNIIPYLNWTLWCGLYGGVNNSGFISSSLLNMFQRAISQTLRYLRIPLTLSPSHPLIPRQSFLPLTTGVSPVASPVFCAPMYVLLTSE